MILPIFSMTFNQNEIVIKLHKNVGIYATVQLMAMPLGIIPVVFRFVAVV